MAGASGATRRVQVVNAHWEAGGAGEAGAFALMVVTDDDERHVLTPSPAAATALLALCASDAVLLWDSEARTLIAAGVVGEWIPPGQYS